MIVVLFIRNATPPAVSVLLPCQHCFACLGNGKACIGKKPFINENLALKKQQLPKRLSWSVSGLHIALTVDVWYKKEVRRNTPISKATGMVQLLIFAFQGLF